MGKLIRAILRSAASGFGDPLFALAARQLTAEHGPTVVAQRRKDTECAKSLSQRREANPTQQGGGERKERTKKSARGSRLRCCGYRERMFGK